MDKVFTVVKDIAKEGLEGLGNLVVGGAQLASAALGAVLYPLGKAEIAAANAACRRWSKLAQFKARVGTNPVSLVPGLLGGAALAGFIALSVATLGGAAIIPIAIASALYVAPVEAAHVDRGLSAGAQSRAASVETTESAPQNRANVSAPDVTSLDAGSLAGPSGESGLVGLARIGATRSPLARRALAHRVAQTVIPIPAAAAPTRGDTQLN